MSGLDGGRGTSHKLVVRGFLGERVGGHVIQGLSDPRRGRLGREMCRALRYKGQSMLSLSLGSCMWHTDQVAECNPVRGVTVTVTVEPSHIFKRLQIISAGFVSCQTKWL